MSELPRCVYVLLAVIILAGGWGLASGLARLISCWLVMKECDEVQKEEKRG